MQGSSYSTLKNSLFLLGRQRLLVIKSASSNGTVLEQIKFFSRCYPVNALAYTSSVALYIIYILYVDIASLYPGRVRKSQNICFASLTSLTCGFFSSQRPADDRHLNYSIYFAFFPLPPSLAACPWPSARLRSPAWGGSPARAQTTSGYARYTPKQKKFLIANAKC